MTTDATAAASGGAVPGMRHWLLQLIPPLLMLGLFFTTRSGTSLVFLAGLLVIPVVISVISIIAKLMVYRKRKYHLPRPLLTLAVFGLILYLAHWSYESAFEQAVAAAGQIHDQCRQDSACPENPGGWQVDGSRVGRNDFGVWLKYPASYRADDESFHIRLYRGPDSGDNIAGGVHLPLAVKPYRDNY